MSAWTLASRPFNSTINSHQRTIDISQLFFPGEKMLRPALLSLVLLLSSLHADERAFPLTARRILFLGDSITNSGYYVAHIETQMRIQNVSPMPEIIGIGLPSETCSGLSEPDHPFPRPDVHERLDRALERVKPDVVIACYGMNDGIYFPFSAERFQAYQSGVKKLVDKCHKAGAKICLLTPPPFDPTPMRDKPGKLLPKGEEKYAWFAIYENYDTEVLKPYARWIMSGEHGADMVVDVHTPLNDFLAEQRRKNPKFFVAGDGVHMNETGHEIMSAAVLKAWGIESWEEPSKELRALVKQKESLIHDAWLSHVGHKRPGVKAGPPVEEAQKKAAELQQKIAPLIKAAQEPRSDSRPSTGGTIYSVHFPAGSAAGELRLYVDYYLWIPEGIKKLRGVIVHQHGCGPGASIGGQTAADDLHWQALAKKQQCALLGSSYEPRKGVNCRLWCDARSGSAARFLQALDHFADSTGHKEIKTVPWCLWGHSGGGFWASLMQTLYPERIVAIWLQSGTAYGYWKKGEIEAPHITKAALGVPVMGNPGGKEKDHERFKVAWNGTKAMQEEYRRAGAAFFEFASDPKTGHECGDSRYLSIPYFDFWLNQRIGESGLRLVNESMRAAWNGSVRPLHEEFIATGAVSDTTPPPAPASVSGKVTDAGVLLTWTAEADFESGLREFQILRDGKLIGTLPRKHNAGFGRALFQGLSYHDTPDPGPPSMTYLDKDGVATSTYSVVSVNSVQLKSKPAKAN